MGHNVGKAADNAVEKSKKKEAVKNRTEGEIVRDIELNLNAGLSVVPLDIRLLLNRYKELKEEKDGRNNSSGAGQESSGTEERSEPGSVEETQV
jgi:hypothetical protein